MHRLKMTITLEYDGDPDFYGTDDPQEMAKIDHVEATNSKFAWFRYAEDILQIDTTSVNVDIGRILSEGENDV